MGSFIGHVVPGLFFFAFAFWWTIQIFRRHFNSFKKNGQAFFCSPTYPPKFSRLKSLDLEGVLIVVSAGIGIFVEIVAACILRHRNIGMGNLQHATMYFFFGLVGLLSIMAPILKGSLPDLEVIRYLTFALALVVEAVLFKFHLFGRDEMDVLVHTLLLYVIYASIITTFAEIKYRGNVICALCRAFLTLLQGTWFFQVAFILYNPIPGAAAWDHDDHHQLMLVVCIFSWHLGAIFLGMLGMGILIAYLMRRAGTVTMVTDFSMGPVSPNGYTTLLNDHDQNDLEITEE